MVIRVIEDRDEAGKGTHPFSIIEGEVKDIIQLTESGFKRVSIVDEEGKRHDVIGTLNVQTGTQLVVVGKTDIHPKYGFQIKAISHWQIDEETVRADSLKRVLHYLYAELRLPPKLAQKIFEAYQADAESVIRDNPYRLATEGRVKRIGVATIDKYFASVLGIEPDDSRRLRADILGLLKQGRSVRGAPVFYDESMGQAYGKRGGGHLFLDFSQVTGIIAERLDASRKTVANEIRAMAAAPRSPIDNRPLIVVEKEAEKERYVYIFGNHVAERGLAYHIKRIMRTGRGHTIPSVRPPGVNGIILSPQQQSAVEQALGSAVSIITGGPGTGKTTVISSITDALANLFLPFCLCAPTGVAARRITAATQSTASTIHRLLGVDPRNGRFVHNLSNPLQASFVIIDETSMMDSAIAYSLLDAIPDGCQVLFVGDVDQLAPVGAGAPLRDLIAWQKIPTTRLTTIYRQELKDSLIIQGSAAVLQKTFPKFAPAASPDPSEPLPPGDLIVHPYAREDKAMEIILDLLLNTIPNRYGIPHERVQIISPHKRMMSARKKSDEDLKLGVIDRYLSTEHINQRIQERIFGPQSDPGERFFVGDRVIHTKNDYELDVMNGEIGYVREINLFFGKKKKREYIVEYPEKTIRYTDAAAKNLDLAYALTVHKSQGTEHDAVIVAAYESGAFFSLNMLYTALTRGKKYAFLVSPKGAKDLKKILDTNELPRSSRLIWRLESDEIGGPPDLVSIDELSSDDDDA